MKDVDVTVALISIAAVVFVLAMGKSILEKRRGVTTSSQRLLQLRRNLLVKALGNEYKVDSLIEFEQAKGGNITLEEAMEAAIERWERDNR